MRPRVVLGWLLVGALVAVAGYVRAAPESVRAQSAGDGSIQIETTTGTIVIDPAGVIDTGQPATLLGDECVSSESPLPGTTGSIVCVGGSSLLGGGQVEVSGIESNPLIPAGGEAVAALGWIAEEAVEAFPLLFDVPDDQRIVAYGRDEIRSYMQARILQIIDAYVFGEPLTEDEQRAFDYVFEQLRQQRLDIAEAAWGEFEKYENLRCGYDQPKAPAFVDEPRRIPGEIRDYCERAKTAFDGVFEVAPPIPAYEDFMTWGLYRVFEDRDLGDEIAYASELQGAMEAGATLGGVLAAIGSGALSAVFAASIVSSTAVLGAVISKVIGSAGVVAAMQVSTGSLAAKIAAASTIGTAAGATVAGIVVFAVVIIALAVLQVVARASIGQGLRAELNNARNAPTIPLWLTDLRSTYSGQPEPDDSVASQFRYRQDQFLSQVVNVVVDATAVTPDGDIVARPAGVWVPSVTTDADHRFRVVSSSPEVVVDSITLPLDDPNAGVGGGWGESFDEFTVRFNRDWMILGLVGGGGTAGVSFTYTDPEGRLLRVSRIAPNPDYPNGAFLLIPLDDTTASQEVSETLRFVDGGEVVEVALEPAAQPGPPQLRPAAVGRLLVTTPVSLRPNPVTATGVFDPDEFSTGYSFDWTVSRFDEATSSFVEVHTASSYGTSFVPSVPGDYRAEVTMIQDGSSAASAVTGRVAFPVRSPEVEITQLDLVDNGLDEAFLDLVVEQDVNSDVLGVSVQWPGEVGGPVGQVSNEIIACDLGTSTRCSTGDPSRWRDRLTVPLTTLTDFEQGVTVTVTNSTGGTTTKQIEFDRANRPTFVAPPPNAFTDPLHEFEPRSSHLQVEVGEVPARLTTFSHVIATVTPRASTGTDPALSLYDPATGVYRSAFGVPGNDQLRVSLTKNAFSGLWQLSVKGLARVQDLGVFEIPLVVRQADEQGQSEATHVLYLNVVPAIGDRSRVFLDNSIPDFGAGVTDVPELRPVVMGGSVGRPPYDGELCLSLEDSGNFEHQTIGPPTVCGDIEEFFDGDVPNPFPYRALFFDGLPSRILRARAVLTDTTQASDTPHLVVFRLETDPPEVTDLQWDDDAETISVTIGGGDPPGGTIVGVECELDGAPAPNCPGVLGGSVPLPNLAAGPHEFKVTVTNQAGNFTTRTLMFDAQDTGTTTTTTVPDDVATSTSTTVADDVATSTSTTVADDVATSTSTTVADDVATSTTTTVADDAATSTTTPVGDDAATSTTTTVADAPTTVFSTTTTDAPTAVGPIADAPTTAEPTTVPPTTTPGGPAIPDGGLPSTGNDPNVAITWALALLGFGVLLTLITRRRRTN